MTSPNPKNARYAATRCRNRAGVSLLEVLVAIFILAIGLLSVATLIPAGQSQVFRSVIEDRKVSVAASAFAEGHARAVFNSSSWMRAGGAAIVPAVDNSYLQGRLIAVDPWLVSQQSTPAELAAVDNFPYHGTAPVSATYANYPVAAPTAVGGAGPPQPGAVMKRLTLRIGTTPIPELLAREIFQNRDDLTFEIPGDPELLPDEWSATVAPRISGFSSTSATTPIKRTAEPRYSWLFTLYPTKLTNQPSQTEYVVSTVVFRDRDPRANFIRDGNDDTLNERFVRFAWGTTAAPAFTAYGGGTAELTSFNTDVDLVAADLDVRPGQWLMVRGFQVGSTAAAPLPMCRWYRITSVDEIVGQSRAITLNGPDWISIPVTAGGLTRDLTATIVANVITVTEHVIRLESPSPWSN